MEFWNRSLDELGVQGMEKSLSPDADWDAFVQSGREELAAAQGVIPMKTGPRRRVLDVGCGLGRVSFALAEQFGEVVGVDIAATLIETARSWNRFAHVRFEHLSGPEMMPGVREEFDTVFANEVFYLIPWPVLTQYSRDAWRLLRPGGEFVFQLNLQPILWKTRISWQIRHILYCCGITKWRGWPTGPGYRRYDHPVDKVRRMLQQIGFRVERIGIGRSVRQTWFLAQKPSSDAADV
jgi:SAM-dependent methyltransferase